MESIYQGLVAPLAIPRDVLYVSCVHDAEAHPGDAHVIKNISRSGEWRRADSFAVFSEAVEEALSKQKRVMGRPILSTVHGVYSSDAPIPVRRQSQSEGELLKPIVIGFLGRLTEYKGLPVFLESIRILRDRGFNVTGAIHGAGPEGRLAQTPLGRECEWNISWIEDTDIPLILDSFDILALPYTEASQSGVVAYALPRGLPTVVTPVGGLGEQVEKSMSGLVSRSTSAADFADSLEKLVSDESLRLELGHNAVEASRSTYSWERVADDFSTWLHDYA